MSENLRHEGEATREAIAEATRAFHERLRDAGLKSTRQRDAIVECFFRLDKHITAEELHQEARKEFRASATPPFTAP